MREKCTVGGQAVIEGVMMRGSKGTATAVRLDDGSITVKLDKIVPYTKKYKVLSIPILRGFVSLIESLVIGIKTLNYSASFFQDGEEEELTGFDKWFFEKFGDKSSDIIMGFSVMISFIFAIGLFFILPTFAANFFKKIIFNISPLTLNIIEGIIRVAIFLLYIYLIGKMEDIKRVYEYHGAEHKSIFCYENEKELTPENAATFGRLHPRCGTNFLFLVMIVSIIVFSLTGWKSLSQRIIYRIVLLPVISGITYEIIKWMGYSKSPIAKALAFPGLMLQKLTTSEPDLKQLEVAITALKTAEGIEDVKEECEEIED